MRNVTPALIAALGLVAVLAVSAWQPGAPTVPPGSSAEPSSRWPSAHPFRPKPATVGPGAAGHPMEGNRPGNSTGSDTTRSDGDASTASCEQRSAQSRAGCLQQDRVEPAKPDATDRPAKRLGRLRQLASHHPAPLLAFRDDRVTP